MMGEFILYYQGKIIGGSYDDRFLVKSVKLVLVYMPEASRELSYPGAKEMLLVGNVDDKDYLSGLIQVIVKELPAPKVKKTKKFRI